MRKICASIIVIISFCHQRVVVGQASSSATPSPAATTCNAQAYAEIWKSEAEDNGLLTKMANCKAQLLRLMQQPFGPPSAFEVMNAVCKGERR